MSTDSRKPAREWVLYRQVSDLSEHESQIAVADNHIHQLKENEDEVRVVERSALDAALAERDSHSNFAQMYFNNWKESEKVITELTMRLSTTASQRDQAIADAKAMYEVLDSIERTNPDAFRSSVDVFNHLIDEAAAALTPELKKRYGV